MSVRASNPLSFELQHLHHRIRVLGIGRDPIRRHRRPLEAILGLTIRCDAGAASHSLQARSNQVGAGHPQVSVR